MPFKTFVIKSLANGLGRSITTRFNPLTGKTEVIKTPLTAWEIWQYKTNIQNHKNELYKAIKPMLERGNFIFDPTLWQWEIEQPNPFQINLWVTITFTDDTGEGKAAFMADLKKTGIMNYDFKIIKPYS